MTHMRPGSKVRLWSPKFTNRPAVHAPGLLKLIAGLSILSVIATLFYAVGLSMTGSSNSITSETAIYVALLHFLMPVLIIYAVSANSPFSRMFLSVYFATLYAATVAGKGFLGNLPVNAMVRVTVASGIFVLLLVWLYRSPKMRVYYALITGTAMPENLKRPAEEIAAPGNVERKIGSIGEQVMEYLEYAVVALVIIGVILGWMVAWRGW